MQRWFQDRPELCTSSGKGFSDEADCPCRLGSASPFSKGFWMPIGEDLAARFSKWWDRMLAVDGSELLWVSFAQLFIHWVVTEEHPGVLKAGNDGWMLDVEYSAAAVSFSFRTRSKRFRLLMFQGYCVATGWQVGYASLRPGSDHIHCQVGCVSGPLKADAHALVQYGML